MKRFILSALTVVTVASIAFSQDKPKQVTVPAAAKSAFEKAFPGATKIKWGKEKHFFFFLRYKGEKGQTTILAIFP